MDLGGDRREALEHDFACVIPFTDDADHHAILDHRQGTDVFLGHPHQRFKHGVVPFDGVDVLVFLVLGFEQLCNGLHGGHSGVVVGSPDPLQNPRPNSPEQGPMRR